MRRREGARVRTATVDALHRGPSSAIVACSAAAGDEAAQAPHLRTVPPPTGAVAPSQHPTLAQGPAPAGFDSSRAYEHLRRQVAFGPRPAGSTPLAQARQYILTQLQTAGITVREETFDATTPLGQVRMVNLVATIPGRRPERIALATHYDTKLFREFRFVGASDGASSTAAVLELGRVLKARQNEFTIELLFFDGEEAVVDWNRNNDNTYGSRRYVETAQKAGTLGGLKALVLLDMIGDRNLAIRRDSNSTPWLTDIIWASGAKLGHRVVLPVRGNDRSMTTICRSCELACRRWTSSTWITPPGIRRKTIWTA